MDNTIVEFIQSKKIAVFGVSRDAKKFGNAIYKELKQRGYEVYAVNPKVDQIEGDPCYPSLMALPGKVDAVVVVVSPVLALEAVEQAAQVGIKRFWLTPGSESKEVLDLARQKGLSPVHNKCVLMYLEPVKSFHSVHRFFVKLFGQL